MAAKSYRDRTFPWLDRTGDVVIPFKSDKKYHWWKGGQSNAVTRKELMDAKNKAKKGKGDKGGTD